jgi:HAMP domain-containing protein
MLAIPTMGVGRFSRSQMPVLHSPVNVEISHKPGVRARLEQAVGLAFGEREHLRRKTAALTDEIGQLTQEIQRLRQENRDLRDAAAIWIRMYENQLSRANSASRPLEAAAPPAPPR